MADPRHQEPESFESFLEGLSDTSRDIRHGAGAHDTSELQRMRAFLRNRYAGAKPVTSTTSRHGHIYDLFPIDNQPASRLHNLIPATPPPPGRLGHVGLQLRNNIATLPPGLVPVRRFTLADLTRFKSLDRFLHKRGAPRRSILRGADAPGTPTQDHLWSEAYQSAGNTGATATLNVWQPQLKEGQIFSLSQIWCVAQGPSGKQSVELGWHVYPKLTGHTEPCLFCYWTADNYGHTGGYNGLDGAFHVNGQTTVIGSPITDVSVANGQQVDIYCAITFYQGNWWLYVGGDQNDNVVGYFPGSLYNNGPLATGAAEVDFGGEVCGGPTYPPMGSGTFANAGAGQAAYQRNLGIYGPDGNPLPALTLTTDQFQPEAYTIDTQASDNWGTYIYFGGPGGNGGSSA